jgi:predicted small secreted protein
MDKIYLFKDISKEILFLLAKNHFSKYFNVKGSGIWEKKGI